MARKVFVSSDIAHDEKLLDVAEQDPTAALLWPWLLTVFDDWGRARAEPRRLKVQVFPGNDLVTVDVISRTLALLREASLIVLYGERDEYMAVEPEVWFRWQTHIRKEKREDDSGSKFPSPPDPREIAQKREESRDRAPSPSPSPSEEHPTGSDQSLFAAFYEFWTGKEYSKNGISSLERGRINKAVKQAKADGITPDQVKDRGQRYRRQWSELERSPQALLGNWSRFEPDVEPIPCDTCDNKGRVGFTEAGEPTDMDDARAVDYGLCPTCHPRMVKP